jgi:predicted nucleic acid-binding protein
MSRFVVDACVAVKWVVSEEHSDAAFHFAREGHDLIVPDLFFPEIANVLWKKCRRGQMDPDKAPKALRALFAIGMTVHTVRSLVFDALEISLRHGCSAYDAVYLALALHENCRLVTADWKFIERMQASELAQIMLWIEDAAKQR